MTAVAAGAIAGRVMQVDAGRGHPDLLTLTAVKAIAAADVILVDDLVHPHVLKHASSHARIVHVGKRGPDCRAGIDPARVGATARPSTPQALIERPMRVEALQGRDVVRLKGGDPTSSAAAVRNARTRSRQASRHA
ncbi:MAG: SAM-dependent methyltransferase [Burkholderiaceae bacterium]